MVTASSSSSSGRDDTLFPFLLLHPRPFYFSLPLGRMLVCFCLWTRHHVHLPTHPSPSCSILPLELRLVRVALPRLGRREAFFICPEQFSSRSMSWIQNTNLVGYFFFLDLQDYYSWHTCQKWSFFTMTQSCFNFDVWKKKFKLSSPQVWNRMRERNMSMSEKCM